MKCCQNRPFLGLSEESINKSTISDGKALSVLNAGQSDIMDVFAEAFRVKCAFYRNSSELCSIINIKSGRCSEDCSFCAQSAKYKTAAEVYPLVEHAKIKTMASNMGKWRSRLGLVSSGKGVVSANSVEFRRILDSIRKITCKGQAIHASLGILSKETAFALKDAGVSVYHHNIETAPSFFKHICRSHSFSDRIKTVELAREAGMEVCCGGILGLGETLKQRVEFARTLKDLEICSIPLNFLNPIKGTPLGNKKPIKSLEALKIVAMTRLVNPKANIRVCGGRETVLGDLQGLIHFAGASGMMIGGYLTTRGRSVEADLRLIEDSGLKAS